MEGEEDRKTDGWIRLRMIIYDTTRVANGGLERRWPILNGWEEVVGKFPNFSKGDNEKNSISTISRPAIYPPFSTLTPTEQWRLAGESKRHVDHSRLIILSPREDDNGRVRAKIREDSIISNSRDTIGGGRSGKTGPGEQERAERERKCESCELTRAAPSRSIVFARRRDFGRLLLPDTRGIFCIIIITWSIRLFLSASRKRGKKKKNPSVFPLNAYTTARLRSQNS